MMKILLIAVVAISVFTCHGTPAGYINDFVESQRDSHLQLTQNSANEAFNPVSNHEQYQAPQTEGQGNRQEYHRFGSEDLFQNSPLEASTFSHERQAADAAITRNPNTELALSNKNQINMFPTTSINQGTRIQKSSLNQQDMRSDSSYAYNPVPHVQTYSNQEIRRPFMQGDEDRTSIAEVHSQEIAQKGTPFTADHQSDIQTGLYTNQNVGAKSSFQDQISQSQLAGNQNQDTSRTNHATGEDQQSQTQGRFLNQNDMRGYYDVDHNRQSLNSQIPKSSQQGQSAASFAARQHENQFQQNQRSTFPVSSFASDGSFRQELKNFESRRIPSTLLRQQNQNLAEEQNKYAQNLDQRKENQQTKYTESRRITSTVLRQQNQNVAEEQNKYAQIPDQRKENQQTKYIESGKTPSTVLRQQNQNFSEEQNKYAQISDQRKENQQIKYTEDARISTDIRSRDDFNRQHDQVLRNKHDSERRIQDVPQGQYQDLVREQATMASPPQLSQLQTTSVLLPVSGTKGTPLVVYKTGNVASPHAVVISRDASGSLSKATISQHLKTPYTHYVYTHTL